MRKFRRLAALLLALLTALSLMACGGDSYYDDGYYGDGYYDDGYYDDGYSDDSGSAGELTPDPDSEPEAEPGIPVEEDGWYYDPENVVLYLHYYGKLPSNFITKDEARSLGWSSGSVEKYRAGAAIGGDRFGNYEGRLPKGGSLRYVECDMYTNGGKSRGACRLVYSNDGRYYYTSDHYKNFRELYVNGEGEIVWK